MRILMMSCRETAQLLSESMDRDVTAFQRFTLRIHLLYCSNCSRFREQLLFLKEYGLYLRANLRKEKLALRIPLNPELRESIRDPLCLKRD